MNVTRRYRPRHQLATRVLLYVFGLLATSWANADMLIQKNVGVTLPASPTSEALSLTSAGVLTVTVTDLAWPQALQTLSFAISDHDGVLAQRSGTGTLMYDIGIPGAYFANVYATPNAFSGLGMYHMNISFMPTVVPLPAAVWLLVSGVFVIGRIVRRNRTRVAKDTRDDKAAVQTEEWARFPASSPQRSKNRAAIPYAGARRAGRPQRRNTGSVAHAFVTNTVVQ